MIGGPVGTFLHLNIMEVCAMKRESQNEMQEKDWMLLLYLAKDLSDRQEADAMVINLWDKLAAYCHTNQLIFREESRRN